MLKLHEKSRVRILRTLFFCTENELFAIFQRDVLIDMLRILFMLFVNLNHLEENYL